MKRERMSKADVEQLERQIYDVLAEDHPQSVRHVFYRMTDPRLPVVIPKTEAGYIQVQNRMVKMRRNGDLPYGWVSDATRRGWHTNTYTSTGDFLQSVADFYRRDLWANVDTHVEVWCESRSIAGVIERTCDQWAVSLYPAGGFSSLTLAYQSAESIKYQLRCGKQRVLILYVGDYDPAGVLIDRSIESELLQHLGNVDLEFRRIAINENQIEQLDLPTKPRKASDRRASHIAATVEAEAMPAALLRELLELNISILIPERELNAVLVAEESERQALNLLAQSI